MKKLIWIDDDIHKMAKLVNSIFLNLWSKGIESYTILMGDYYKSKSYFPDYNSNDLSCFRNKAVSSFARFCNFQFYKSNEFRTMIGYEEIENENYDDLSAMQIYQRYVRRLINDNIVKIISKNELRISEEKFSYLELFKNVIEDLSAEKYSFAVDVRLIKNDYKNILEGNSIACVNIIKELKQNNYSFVLYSSYEEDEEFNEKLKKVVEKEVDSWNFELLNSLEFQKNDTLEVKRVIEICK